MTELYPIKFEPVLKEKVWGGDSLAINYGKKAGSGQKIGESWEISAVTGELSVVSNGFLAGNNIEEIIEVYMGDITGDAVYERFGNEFPLLIKILQANDDLSVQVHPSDELARERHNAYGKTEMWHILESRPGARIYTGFREKISKEQYLNALEEGTIIGILNSEEAIAGDTFFTPAGRIHAIGAGITLVEIQQTSDITYRIFDWHRNGDDGMPRELHTELALGAIDFSAAGQCKIVKEPVTDKTVNLVRSSYFVTNILQFHNNIRKDYNSIDSFVIYVCTSGSFIIHWEKGAEVVTSGETVLIPAVMTDLVLEPRPEASLLEIFTDYTGNYLK
jgi:mannose-6-phosphate isomerase